MKRYSISTFPESANSLQSRVYVGDDKDLWMGWRDETGWRDAYELNKHPLLESRNRVPTWWSPSLREFTVELPEERGEAGEQLLGAVDNEKLPVQGAMWAHSPNIGDGFMTIAPDRKIRAYPRPFGWKYLLVTPNVNLVRDRLPSIFRSGKVSQAMVIDDVDVVGAGDPMFQLLAKWIKVDINGGKSEFKGSQHVWSHEADDGTVIFCEMRCNAVVYRSLKTIDGSDFKRPEERNDESSSHTLAPFEGVFVSGESNRSLRHYNSTVNESTSGR